MPVKTIRELFEYDCWAYERGLATAAVLTDEQLDRSFENRPGRHSSDVAACLRGRPYLARTHRRAHHRERKSAPIHFVMRQGQL